MRIGHLSTFYHTAVLLMSDPRSGERLGARPQWRLFGTGPAIVEALGQGELDMAYIGLPPAIIGIASGVAIKCVAGGHIEGTVIAGAGGAVAYPEAAGAEEVLGQFRGRTIGVPGKGSIHDVILSELLHRTGLGAEISVRNFKWSDNILEAFVHGEVAAAIGTPALAVALKRFAGGRVLYPPNQLWPGNPSYGIVATASYIEQNAPLIKRFLMEHEAVAQRLREKPTEAAEEIAAFVGTVDAEFVAETLSLSPRYCAQLSQQYVSTTMGFVTALKRLGYIEREPLLAEIFEPGIIAQAHPPGDHY